MASKSIYHFTTPSKLADGWTANPPKIGGLGIETIIVDEMWQSAASSLNTDFSRSFFEEQYMTKHKADELGAEVTERLTKLAEGLTGYFKDNTRTVKLFAPTMLTVKVVGTGYKKVSHIGGEEFKIDGVYLGKKGKLIFTFAPVDTVTYSHMEMEGDEALASLEHFRNAVDAAVGGDFVQVATAIRRLEADAREAAASASKFTEYEDIGFGSW